MATSVRRQRHAYGQLVIGPPGAGKSTYCHRMAEFLTSKLRRSCAIINLDPGNESMLYNPSIDVRQLITVEEVMQSRQLGPNGALMYCMQYLELNLDWLMAKLNGIEGKYLLFDLPGQVELFTHHSSIANICNKLTNNEKGEIMYHLCVCQLVDSHYCSEPSKFLSTLLMALTTMLQLGLPQVNALSKADEMAKRSSFLAFNTDFYTDVLDLQHLLDLLNDENDDETSSKNPKIITFNAKYRKLNAALVDLVQDYSLVQFQLLNVASEQSLLNMRSAVDKANGYVYNVGEERSIQALLACAVGVRTETETLDADL